MNFLKPFKAAWRMTPFSGPEKPLVNVIEFTGAIGIASGPTSKRGLNMASMEKTIEEAFKPSHLAAVALSINSPGGSPVQSRLIYRAIRRHAEAKKVPVFAFIEDVGASAGYILALSADEIYADESSIVGSIGVISAGFGFTELIAKYGIERRVYAAGANKSTLDPFSPENPDHVAHFQTLLDENHSLFIDFVKQHRGNKINDEFEDIFTGLFWAANGAKERGLIDGMAQLTDFMYDRFGEHVNIKKCNTKEGGLLSKLLGTSSMVGRVAIGKQGPSRPLSGQSLTGQSLTGQSPSGLPALIEPEAVLSTLEERALWARFGM